MYFGSYSYVRYLKGKWYKYAKHVFWGDRLDVRFYLTWQVKSLHDKKILDMGCGSGIMLSEIAVDNIRIGVDMDTDSLRLGRDVPGRGILVQGDITKLPFRDHEFDAVLLNCVFEAVPDPEKEAVFMELKRVIKSNGELFMTATNKSHLRYHDKKDCYSMTYGQLMENLDKYFKVDICGFNPFPPFPLFLPSRILQYIPGIWQFLLWLMRNGFFKEKCQFFYIKGHRL